MVSIIYIRTSTTEQTPELQLAEVKTLAPADAIVYMEQQSAFKDSVRPVFEKIYDLIKNGEVQAIYVWDFDRLYRDRKKLVAFFQLCKGYKCAIHSCRQRYVETIHNMPPPWNEALFDLMIQIHGSIAEEESQLKSQRIKNAIRKQDGSITKSYKGKVWGRHSLKPEINKQIIELRAQGQSIRQIASSVFYWNKNNNKRFVSVAYVHKTLAANSPVNASLNTSS